VLTFALSRIKSINMYTKDDNTELPETEETDDEDAPPPTVDQGDHDDKNTSGDGVQADEKIPHSTEIILMIDAVLKKTRKEEYKKQLGKEHGYRSGSTNSKRVPKSLSPLFFIGDVLTVLLS
jgi:hypothetical protein